MDFKQKYEGKIQNYQYPDRNIDPREKLKKSYAKMVAESIFCAQVNNKCLIPFGMYSTFDLIRAFARGQQPHSIYSKFTGSDEPKQGTLDTMMGEANKIDKERKADGSIDKSILSPAPRIARALDGIFADVDFDLDASTIDPDSLDAIADEQSLSLAKGQHKDFLDKSKIAVGIPPDTDTKYPTSIDELKIMDSLGEFKTPVAKALEKICKHTYENNDWNLFIKKKLVADWRDFNQFCYREVYNDELHKYELEYVDVTRMIAQWSDTNDYTESCFFGLVKMRKISDIRYKLERAGYTEAQIKQLAFSWCGNGELLGLYGGMAGNPLERQFVNYEGTDSKGTFLYDYWNVLVLEVDYMENDTEYLTVKPNKFNGEKTTFFGRDSRGEGEIVTTTYKRMYQASWIIGTECVYDNMIKPSQPKNLNNRRPIWSWHIYVGLEQAITPQLMPVYSNFQVSWLKFQEKNQQLHDEIMMIDISILDRFVEKGDYKSLLNILKEIKSSGIMPYRSLPINGKYGGGNVKPLERMPSTMLTHIEEFEKAIVTNFQIIEFITGINALAIGGSPPPRTSADAGENAVAATARVLRPFVDGLALTKNQSAEFLCHGIPLAVRNDKKSYEAYARATSQADVDALKKSTYDATELGIKLVSRATADEKKIFYQEIIDASQPGKDGKPLLRFDVKMYLIEKLRKGANLTDLRLYMSSAIDKEIERQDQERQQIQQAELQRTNSQAQIAAKAQQDKEMAKAQAKIITDNNEHKNKMEENSMLQFHERYIKKLDQDHEKNMAGMGDKPPQQGQIQEQQPEQQPQPQMS
jgi:hypothetical protein